MPKGYSIGEIEITNLEGYEKYRSQRVPDSSRNLAEDIFAAVKRNCWKVQAL
jgi:uncharacterized protein (DUF1330 family)